MKRFHSLSAVTAVAASLAVVFASVAHAQAVRTERNISLALANEIAGATVAACSANGYNVAATVVDRAGTDAR